MAFYIYNKQNNLSAERVKFVYNLAKMQLQFNTKKQMQMLKEKNIRKFKGFFSQNLYDLLICRRLMLLQEVKEAKTCLKIR